jgi:hypothetical protein
MAHPIFARCTSWLWVKKLPYDQAWALVREEWAFLPSEEDDDEAEDPFA